MLQVCCCSSPLASGARLSSSPSNASPLACATTIARFVAPGPLSLCLFCPCPSSLLSPCFIPDFFRCTACLRRSSFVSLAPLTLSPHCPLPLSTFPSPVVFTSTFTFCLCTASPTAGAQFRTLRVASLPLRNFPLTSPLRLLSALLLVPCFHFLRSSSPRQTRLHMLSRRFLRRSTCLSRPVFPQLRLDLHFRFRITAPTLLPATLSRHSCLRLAANAPRDNTSWHQPITQPASVCLGTPPRVRFGVLSPFSLLFLTAYTLKGQPHRVASSNITATTWASAQRGSSLDPVPGHFPCGHPRLSSAKPQALPCQVIKARKLNIPPPLHCLSCCTPQLHSALFQAWPPHACVGSSAPLVPLVLTPTIWPHAPA
ncbi:hypothetical protein TRVL_07214 [Trypanosoma vivax]|nr:hypothetical protein TRVL_07214 [Trypanosoma vivax]